MLFRGKFRGHEICCGLSWSGNLSNLSVIRVLEAQAKFKILSKSKKQFRYVRGLKFEKRNGDEIDFPVATIVLFYRRMETIFLTIQSLKVT